MRNVAVEVILLSGAGLAGWYGGKWSERKASQSCNKPSVLPGVPLFGTVSAATPISPKEIVPVDENTTKLAPPQSRVSQVSTTSGLLTILFCRMIEEIALPIGYLNT